MKKVIVWPQDNHQLRADTLSNYTPPACCCGRHDQMKGNQIMCNMRVFTLLYIQHTQIQKKKKTNILEQPSSIVEILQHVNGDWSFILVFFFFFLIVPPLKCTTGCLCGVCDARKLWRQSSGTENKITVFLNPFQNKLINTNAPRSLKLQIERSQRTYAELVCERILQNVC